MKCAQQLTIFWRFIVRLQVNKWLRQHFESGTCTMLVLLLINWNELYIIFLYRVFQNSSGNGRRTINRRLNVANVQCERQRYYNIAMRERLMCKLSRYTASKARIDKIPGHEKTQHVLKLNFWSPFFGHSSHFSTLFLPFPFLSLFPTSHHFQLNISKTKRYKLWPCAYHVLATLNMQR